MTKVSFVTALSLLFFVSCARLQVTAGKDNYFALARQVAEGALEFTEGDISSLKDAQDDFTPAGWETFLKQLAISPDDRGAPQFSSTFTPSEIVLIGDDERTVRLGIGGTLKQSRAASSTNYRVVVYIQLDKRTKKVSSLEISTCGGASTSKSCPIDMSHKFPLEKI